MSFKTNPSESVPSEVQEQSQFVMPGRHVDSNKYSQNEVASQGSVYSVQQEETPENTRSEWFEKNKTFVAAASGLTAIGAIGTIVWGMQQEDANKPALSDVVLNTKPAIVEKDQTGFGQKTIEETLSATAEASDLAVVNPANLVALNSTATPTPTATVQEIAAVEATATPTSEALLSQEGVVASMGGQTLNLRNAAGEPVWRISENSAVKVAGITEDGKWLQVTTADGKIGWASADYITVPNMESLAVIPDIEINPVIATSTGIGGGEGPAAVNPIEPAVAAPAAPVASAVVPAGNPIFPNVEQVPSAIGVEGLKPGEAIYNLDGFVETATNVLKATGEFKNTLGFGTETYLADPGVVMISDFVNADGTLDEELMKAYAESQGRIELINPSNQYVFTTEKPEYFKIPEQGFTLVSGKTYRVDLPDGRFIELAGGEGVVWNLVIRGQFGDSNTETSVMNTDRHLKPVISNYVGGHTMATVYPEGAFISQGHYEQIIQLSHLDEDCGDGGCSRAMNAYIDVNTGAFMIYEHNYVTGQYALFAKNFN